MKPVAWKENRKITIDEMLMESETRRPQIVVGDDRKSSAGACGVLDRER